MVLLVILEVVFVTGTPPPPPHPKVILEEACIMGVLFHIRVIKHYLPWCHNSLRSKQLVIWVVLPLVVVIVKMVWVLGPPTLHPKKLIVVLIVVVLCHCRVRNNIP